MKKLFLPFSLIKKKWTEQNLFLFVESSFVIIRIRIFIKIIWIEFLQDFVIWQLIYSYDKYESNGFFSVLEMVSFSNTIDYLATQMNNKTSFKKHNNERFIIVAGVKE